MERTYHLCHYRIDGRGAYLICYANNTDGIVTDAGGRILEFPTPEEAHRHAAAQMFRIADGREPALYDFDGIERWIQDCREEVPCEEFLNAWNLFTDISCSVGGAFDGDIERTSAIYDKLFFGNNLPGTLPPGERYVPEWTRDELLLLREILADGLLMFRSHLAR